MPIFDDYVKTPLRFYDRLEKQNRYFQEVCNEKVECLYKLITPSTTNILPFMIKHAHSGRDVASFTLIEVDTGNATALNPAVISKVETDDFDYFIYTGADPIGPTMACGYYYVHVTDTSNNRWYSEVFWISDQAEECYLKLEWTNTCDFDGVYYSGGFTHKYYVDPRANVMEMESRLVREGKENGERDTIFTFQKVTPAHLIETELIPSYLKEALDFMQLHNGISLTLKNQNGSGSLKNVTISGKWEFDSCYFRGSIRFELDSSLKTECCGDELEVTNVCHTFCYQAHEDPGSGWVVGQNYMHSDGRIKQFTGNGFIYHFCNSQIVRNIDTSEDWCFDVNSQAWYLMPSITDITVNATGTGVVIKAIGAPGSNVKLFVDGVLETTLVSEIFAATGYEFLMAAGESHDFHVTSTTSTPLCSYGVSDVVTYEMPAVMIMAPYHKIQRNFVIGDLNTITLNSLLCNGVEQLSSPVVLNLNTTNITFATGLDGNLYLQEIMDAVNAELPAGYRCHDDMRVVEYPDGESFEFHINLVYSGSFGTSDTDYIYDNSTGFTIIP